LYQHFFIIASFTACNSGELNTKAEATANSFYKDLQEKKYDSALSQVSAKAFESDPKEKWLKGFKKNDGLLGNIVSFTKTSGFNIQTSTNVGTTVTVAYDTKWQYGTSKDTLVLIKDANGNMKIYSYAWQHKDAKYLHELTESEKQADQYMSSVKAGNFDAAIDLCAESALATTPRDEWKKFLNLAVDKLGAIESYKILKDSSTYDVSSNGDAGPGNYYDVYITSARAKDPTVPEKMVFYQKDYESPVKLVGHKFL